MDREEALRLFEVGDGKARRLGSATDGSEMRVDKRLPEITSLIDPAQFDLITRVSISGTLKEPYRLLLNQVNDVRHPPDISGGRTSSVHPILNGDVHPPPLKVGCKKKKKHIILRNVVCQFCLVLNQYRIEDAKKLLCLEDGQLQAILSIAFEVGFNSNSAFYAAFKKSCGQTPAQFRQSRRSSEA